MVLLGPESGGLLFYSLFAAENNFSEKMVILQSETTSTGFELCLARTRAQRLCSAKTL